jgi:hemerythrin-like domain-containing protein
MRTPSEVLREEHEVMGDLLRVLKGMTRTMDRGERVPRMDLEVALDLIENFAEKCHHTKEDKVVFPVLVTTSPTQGAFLAMRLDEGRRAGRRLVGALPALVDGVVAGEPSVRSQFTRLLGSYVTILEDQLRQEDGELLPMMDEVLPSRITEAVSAEFSRIERDLSCAAGHARYEAAIHDLADKYSHPSLFA